MQDLAIHLENNLGLVAIAVGFAEGTRRLDGSFTTAFWGHKDPGNQRRNQGTFSYQGQAASAIDADNKQLNKLLTQLLPRFEGAAPSSVFKDHLKLRLILFVTACDCFVQSEAACCAQEGFLDLIEKDPTIDIIEARVLAYYDPETGNLDAPGFGNNLDRLRADQTRRQECINAAISAHT